MDKSKIFLYRFFLPILIITVVTWALVLIGILPFAIALLIQSVGVSFVIVANFVWIALLDVPARYPDSNYTKQLNRITFVREDD